MKPSEKTRKFTLKVSSGKWQSTVWIDTGIIFAIIGVIILCICGINNEIPLTSKQIENGVIIYEETKYVKSFVIALPFFGWAFIITPIVVLFIRFVAKMIYKGIIEFEPATIKISKTDLIQKALMEERFTVENYGDWLDFSLNWKNCFSVDVLNASASKTIALYKKLIKLNDDYTYEELDYEAIGTMNFSLMKFSFYKQSQLGHISHHCIEYNLGKDNETEHIGINKYTLNTLDFTNEVHKWLAENGYKLRENW